MVTEITWAKENGIREHSIVPVEMTYAEIQEEEPRARRLLPT